MALKGFAKIIVVVTTISAAIMELLDTSIVNVALFDMAGSLGVNVEDVAWVITSYAIANVIVIPLTGFLAEYFGRKNYYIASMVLFMLASYVRVGGQFVDARLLAVCTRYRRRRIAIYVTSHLI